MPKKTSTSTNQNQSSQITEEYRVLHKVAQILQNPGELNDILQKTMPFLPLIVRLQTGTRPDPTRPAKNRNRHYNLFFAGRVGSGGIRLNSV